ncbi:Hypothetical protein CINCED_3A001336 [Cinara cedri]|uniref:Uncharacterized protein n=1 Tax=Cinara cedri TaxID=506608 RepID=A0A5E4N3U5_9HEMI|nr:Hypothetical protein CINCED_3A001336 [Cinara cedri]
MNNSHTLKKRNRVAEKERNKKKLLLKSAQNCTNISLFNSAGQTKKLTADSHGKYEENNLKLQMLSNTTLNDQAADNYTVKSNVCLTDTDLPTNSYTVLEESIGKGMMELLQSDMNEVNIDTSKCIGNATNRAANMQGVYT